MTNIKLISNYNEITRRAILHRYKLDSYNDNNDPFSRTLYENLLVKEISLDFLKDAVPNGNYLNNLSHNLSNYFKTKMTQIKILNEFFIEAELNSKKLNDNIKQFYIINRKNLRETEKLLNLSQIKNRVFNSNSLIKNTFQDSLKLHEGFLFDPKTNAALSSKDICNPSEESLTIQEISNYKFKSKFIHVDHSKTSGEIWGNDYSNLYNIYDEGKIFRCIMRKSRRDIFANNEYLSSGATLSLIFDFEIKKYFNSIRISEASLKKITIEENAIEYLNNQNQWVQLEFNYDKLKDNYNIFFDSIYTNQIRITFKQLTFVDIEGDVNETSYSKSFYQTIENTETDFLYYYYDLSISEISFEYSTYRNKGIYRSNELLSVYKPMSLRFKTDILFSDPDVVVEKYLRIMLFTDRDVVAKIFQDTNSEIKLNMAIIDEVIPVNESFYHEDILVPTKISEDYFESKLTFLPEKDSLEYEGFDQSEIKFYNLNDSIIEDTDVLSIYNSGGIKIRINKKYDFTKKYSLKYRIRDNVKNFLGRSCFLLNGQIEFLPLYQESIGFIQPIILIRSKSKFNDSTSVVSSYKLIVQEKEYTNKKNITFDIFLAENKGVI